MSVLEDLRGIEQRIAARLEELQPLVDEYEELQQIAKRLGVDLARPAGSTLSAKAASGGAARRSPGRPRRTTTSKARSSRKNAGGTRAVGAERRERVVTMIKEQPGITVPDISRELGIDPPPVYRIVRKLQSDGVVTKEGKELRPA